MKTGPVRWHWLYRGYLCLVALVVMVFWLEDLTSGASKHRGMYAIMLVMTVFFLMGAIRGENGQADPLMGRIISWTCIAMLHILLLVRFL